MKTACTNILVLAALKVSRLYKYISTGGSSLRPPVQMISTCGRR